MTLLGYIYIYYIYICINFYRWHSQRDRFFFVCRWIPVVRGNLGLPIRHDLFWINWGSLFKNHPYMLDKFIFDRNIAEISHSWWLQMIMDDYDSIIVISSTWKIIFDEYHHIWSIPICSISSRFIRFMIHHVFHRLGILNSMSVEISAWFCSSES